jgi:hypothetical protein
MKREGVEKGFAIGEKMILSTPFCSDKGAYPQGRTPINSQ